MPISYSNLRYSISFSLAILLQVQIKDKELIKEGDRSDKLYIIREGQCALFKTTYVKDMLGVPVKKEERLMNIEVGEIFGEDCLCFAKDNQYTVKATSTKVTLLVISYKDL